jgi:LmbE family N-acetylglucosaminyl deacetylase
VSIGIDSLIRGVARPRPEATEPPREEAAVLARLGDPSGKGMMSFLVLRKFVLDGVEFTPAPGVRVLTPESHRESLDPRGFIAFEPHPDDIALFAGAFTSEAKGVVPIHMISCMPDPAGITDQYLADLLALTTFAIDNPNVSSRLVHAKLIGRSVFGDKSEASDAAAKLRGLFTPREQLALANRFKMNFPALDMGEVDRIRSLFTPSEWRRHKRSLRVYEGYLGFQYMGKETDENDYTNMVWDLPLVKGAFSPNGTLLSYWSKYQAPSEKDALKLRQTLRSLKHMGTVVLPAPHHRHPQHRQLTRVAIPLIAEELPHAKIMLYEDLTGFTHLRANMLNCIEGGTGMWMAKVWEAYGSQEARNPYRAMWYNHVRRAALREADVIEQQVKEEKWQHLAERFVVGTLRRLPRQILD